jgi:hypothetical protein
MYNTAIFVVPVVTIRVFFRFAKFKKIQETS